MNIPHYSAIVTHPMDSSAFESKLDNSTPGRSPCIRKSCDTCPGPIHCTCSAGVSNCVEFNCPEHMISLMGRRLESRKCSVNQLSIKNLPFTTQARYRQEGSSPTSRSLSCATFPSNACPAVHLRRLLLLEEMIHSLLAEVDRRGTFILRLEEPSVCRCFEEV